LDLEVIDYLVLVFNVPLKFPDLMLVAIHLVVLDASEFFDLSLAGTLLTVSLTLDQSNILLFLGLPSCQIFLGFSSQIFLSVFKVSNLFIASLDLNFLESNGLSQFRDKRIFFSIFILKSLDLALKLLDLQVIDFLDILDFLNKNRLTEPALLDSLSS